MENYQQNDSSSIKQVFSIIKEMDQHIEEWVYHIIDQIESANEQNSG